MIKQLFYTWNSVALNPERSDALEVLDLTQIPIETAITVAYPSLPFCELVDVINRVQMATPLNVSVLLQNYGYAYDSKLQSLIEKLRPLPQIFWQWCQTRSLSPRDLFPFLSVSDLTTLNPLLQNFAQLNLTRQLGSQILEILIECILLKVPSDHLQPPSEKSEDGALWLQHLQHLRFPQTYSRDQEKQQTLMQLPWTKEIQTRWLRQGDRSGVEIRFFASSSSELQKRVQELQNVVQHETQLHESH